MGARIVAAGYDRIGRRYVDWARAIEGDPRDRFLAELAARLPDGARVLDLGCGAGVPTTRALAERYEVTGVDLSRAQLALARPRVPRATFVHADACELDLPAASLDAVVALYALSHVPRERHRDLFARIAGWLRRGGVLLATLGTADEEGVAADWLGAPMFFSSHAPEVNRRLLRDAGLALERDELLALREPDGEARFQWVLARRGGA